MPRPRPIPRIGDGKNEKDFITIDPPYTKPKDVISVTEKPDADDMEKEILDSEDDFEDDDSFPAEGPKGNTKDKPRFGGGGKGGGMMKQLWNLGKKGLKNGQLSGFGGRLGGRGSRTRVGDKLFSELGFPKENMMPGWENEIFPPDDEEDLLMGEQGDFPKQRFSEPTVVDTTETGSAIIEDAQNLINDIQANILPDDKEDQQLPENADQVIEKLNDYLIRGSDKDAYNEAVPNDDEEELIMIM